MLSWFIMAPYFHRHPPFASGDRHLRTHHSVLDSYLFLLGWLEVPIGSMYGIFTYIYAKNQPNVGVYTIHGWHGVYSW